MKLTLLQESLSKGLNIASRFTSSRAQLPVLSNILFTAKKNKLSISATNLETSVNIAIGADIKSEGEITIPAKAITDIISNLSPGQINLEVDKEQVKVSKDGFKSTIAGMNSSDFPAIPQRIGKKTLSLPSEEFTKALSQVIFSISIDETRPILTGMLMVLSKGRVTLVSTDGFRLTEKVVPVKGLSVSEKIIIPKSVLSELGRLIGGSTEIDISFSKENSQIIFGLGDIVLSSRVIAGEFPDYKKRIPDTSKISANLDKEEFVRAVKLASVFARDAANITKLTVQKNAIEFSAESTTSGSQKNKVEAETKGGEVEMAFNYRFLEEITSVIEGEEVQVEFNDESSPGVFKDPKDNNFLHIIMPVKVQS